MKPLVIVGDVLLDVDIETGADRLVPDTPAPVLDERNRITRAGGAALAAAFAAETYNGPITLIAPMAADSEAAQIAALLDKRVRLIPIPASGRTPVKTRLRCGATTVARLDSGDHRLSIGDVPPSADEASREAAAVLVSDYGGGSTTVPAMRSLVAAAASRIPVVWDPHPRGGPPPPGVSLVTPNQSEAERATGVRADPGIAGIRDQAFALLELWQPQAVAITLGSGGALLVDRSQRCTVIPADAAGRTADTCGAGDCLAGTVAGRLVGGELISAALEQGVASASAFVAGAGPAERTAVAGDAVQPHSAERLADSLRRRGRTVVATGGCFDLLHAGHVEMLAAARRLGDCLIVCLNSDTSVRRLKGPGRPLQSEADRARVLRALRCVDAVAIFDEATPHNVLRRLRPHLWVKGDDYSAGELPELDLVRSWGGEAVTVPYLAGRSTSELVALSRR